MSGESSVLRVWAPYAERVDLLLADERRPLRAGEQGWWHHDEPLTDGASYAFSLDGGQARPDPRGLRLPDGPHGWSARFDPSDHRWQDRDWPGVGLEGSVVYELHVGTYSPEGTLDGAAARLPHLVDLGVDVVELLPLAPFPGRHGWGYDGVAPYAVHETYGGPAALQRFVEAAHGHGLGVCLDVVYNHLGPDGNYLPEFGPYLTDRYATPWGQALNLDGPDSDPVRDWVLGNVRQWLDGFHVDGLRLDAVHELHDDGAVPLLEAISREVADIGAETGRPRFVVAESDRNDPRTVTPRGEGAAVGGLGMDGQWADDVHHALHVALTGETRGYYADFADPTALATVMRSPFFHDGTWSSFRQRRHGRPVDTATVPGWRFVASLQTHDQVGNRALGDRLSARLDPGLLACGAAILLTSPWTPMLFMGEEWGAATPWQFFTDHTDDHIAVATREGRRAEFGGHGWDAEDVPDPQDPQTFRRSRLDWSEPSTSPHAELLAWYTALLRLRREQPDLRASDLTAVQVDFDAGTGRFAMRRGAHDVLVNLGDRPASFETQGSVRLSWSAGASVTDGVVVVPPGSAVVTGR